MCLQSECLDSFNPDFLVISPVMSSSLSRHGKPGNPGPGRQGSTGPGGGLDRHPGDQRCFPATLGGRLGARLG